MTSSWLSISRLVCTVLLHTSDSSTLFSSTTSSSAPSSFSVATQNSSEPSDLWTHLPAEWTRFCDVNYDVDADVSTTISCHVTADDHWRLVDLRAALSSSTSTMKLEIWVNLTCSPGGRVSLPWPMRCPGLVRLTVVNCLLLDKYMDFNTSAEQIPDSLTHLDMRDCIWLNDPDKLDYVLDNGVSVTDDFECGQDSTLRVYRIRNVTDTELHVPKSDPCDPFMAEALQRYNMSFPEDMKLLLQWPDQLFDTFINDTKHLGRNFLLCAERLAKFRVLVLSGPNEGEGQAKGQGPSDQEDTTLDPNEDARQSRIALNQIKTACNYRHLELQDESQTKPIDRKHFEYLVENTQFPMLRLLNYSHTGLGEVPKEIREWRVYFQQAPLKLVDLSHNMITEVGHIPVYPNPQQNVSTTLNLQFNNITRLSLQLLQDWAEVPDLIVDVRNNPIDCSCDMRNLRELVISLDDHALWEELPMKTYRQHLSVMACATPLSLFGRVIDNLKEDELSCVAADHNSGPYVVVIVMLLVLVIVLLLLLALALRYRKEVRILLYTRFDILIPCGAREARKKTDASQKLYDAFVAHAHEDSEWVLGPLLSRLEQPPTSRRHKPLSLCIHQRDFIVGKPIIDNIIDCIAASRHTIIVMSKSFAKSSWAMEELRQAYRQSLEERRRHLLVVRLEEVPESDMDSVLRRCCKTFTYIDVTDSLFWDRLQYSLHITADPKTKPRDQEEAFDNVAYSPTQEDVSCNHNVHTSVAEGNSNSGDFSTSTLFSEAMKTSPLEHAVMCSSETVVSIRL